jgi:hypothetical protein
MFNRLRAIMRKGPQTETLPKVIRVEIDGQQVKGVISFETDSDRDELGTCVTLVFQADEVTIELVDDDEARDLMAT